jgi:K+-sensing histidine kinase KdpD
VDINEIIKKKLEERKEILEAKQVNVKYDESGMTISFHQHLAEILLSNLLNNAIRYTPKNGTIEILLLPNSLQVSNSSENGGLDTSKVFQRFYKRDSDNTGTGLGLAIIYEIGNLAGFNVQYDFKQNKHLFTINFK